jgi:uncharacterized membrane protein YfcA
MDVLVLIMIGVMMFVFEVIDSSLGQGYGTLGTPVLLLLGFNPKIIVPSILISQAIGGMVGAYWHNRYKNADFSNHNTIDMKRVYVIVASGIIGVIVASWIGIRISKDILSLYIGMVVTVMGVLILSGIVVKYTWSKLCVLGTISAINKGLSGGGYGPVVAGGQVVIGVKAKNSVGITDFAEAPICIAGFIAWVICGGALPPVDMMVSMCVGAGLAPMVGAYITYKIQLSKFKKVLGAVILVLGILCLMRVLSP